MLHSYLEQAVKWQSGPSLCFAHASCDSPMHRTWTLMLSVQVYRHGQSSNLGKNVEDVEAEISLICVLKAS